MKNQESKGERICPVCCTTTPQRKEPQGTFCQDCETLFTGEETREDLARMRREKLGLSRAKIAETFHLSKKTIKFYETRICAKSYTKRLEELLQTAHLNINQPSPSV